MIQKPTDRDIPLYQKCIMWIMVICLVVWMCCSCATVKQQSVDQRAEYFNHTRLAAVQKERCIESQPGRTPPQYVVVFILATVVVFF